MTILKSFLLPLLSLLWIGAIVSYPLYAGILSTPSSATPPPQAAPAVAVETSTEQVNQVISGMPRHISVAKVGVDIGVDDGMYDFNSNTWAITEDAAFFATVTVPANTEGGSTFIYGHNSQKVFGNLLKLEGNAEAVVTTDNGYKFTYEFRNRETVDPNDTSVLEYQGAPRIMLQTCTGLFNEHREMFYFYLKSTEKII